MTPKAVTRYAVSGPEGEFEPGSRGRVLRNLPGIRSAREIGLAETIALEVTQERLIRITKPRQRFTARDVQRIHALWLREIYTWAGCYRQTNLSTRDGFPFASAGQIPRLMGELEQGALIEFTPCRFDRQEDQARALATVHAELILIHPFREGNGRSARLLAVLMGLQAGLPQLDFSGIRIGAARQAYFAAIRTAMGRDYGPITSIFSRVIAKSCRTDARRPRA